MMKIYCRFRFIDINYGPYLWKYLSTSAYQFDPPSYRSYDEIAKRSRRQHGNLFDGKVATELYEYNEWLFKAFFLCWMFKIIAEILLWVSQRSDKICGFSAYFIYYQ